MFSKFIMFSKVCFTSPVFSLFLALFLSRLFTMTDVKHYIQIGSGRFERSLHLLWGTHTLRRLIVRGGTENCAVMVENAERLIWAHFAAAIISLSLSSNKHRRRVGGKKERKKNKINKSLLWRTTWDVSVTLCWQFSMWIQFRQMQTYQGEPLLSLVDWLSFVLRCNCAAVWHYSPLTNWFRQQSLPNLTVRRLHTESPYGLLLEFDNYFFCMNLHLFTNVNVVQWQVWEVQHCVIFRGKVRMCQQNVIFIECSVFLCKFPSRCSRLKF